MVRSTRVAAAIVAACSSVALSSMALAANCAPDVQAAFTKQHSMKYRSEISSPATPGRPTETIDYEPPLKMYRKIVDPEQDFPIETLGWGNRAWSREGADWFELKPHIAAQVEGHLRDQFGKAPEVKTEFECLGKVSVDGKEYLGYQTKPEKSGDSGDMIARQIYVDAATGLPAFNNIGFVGAAKPALVREAYSYPTDIDIVAPEGAPAAP
jgi:hypothetical protein